MNKNSLKKMAKEIMSKSPAEIAFFLGELSSEIETIHGEIYLKGEHNKAQYMFYSSRELKSAKDSFLKAYGG